MCKANYIYVQIQIQIQTQIQKCKFKYKYKYLVCGLVEKVFCELCNCPIRSRFFVVIGFDPCSSYYTASCYFQNLSVVGTVRCSILWNCQLKRCESNMFYDHDHDHDHDCYHHHHHQSNYDHQDHHERKGQFGQFKLGQLCRVWQRIYS